MPAFESSEPSISFNDYFNNPLPKDVVEDFPCRATHLAKNIDRYLSSKTLIRTSKRVLSQRDIDTAAASLKPFQSVKEPILQVQAFASEQDVCDAFHSHVLAKVVPALSGCLETFYREPALEAPQSSSPSLAQLCKQNGYTVYQDSEVRIKLQQDNIDTKQRHSDNVAFFGPIEKIAAGQTTVVVATTTFKRRLKSAIRSVQLNKLEATKIQWPVVALFIVEEKAAGIVKGCPWNASWNSDLDNVKKVVSDEVKNVFYILPQLRLYSRDACCPYVAVTDYLETVLFFVEDDGLLKRTRRNRVDANKPDNGGLLYVEQVSRDRGAKFLLFAAGLKVLRKALDIKHSA
ncbi:hypothetical protein CPB85DRAFT_920211 [Mucidula mucida]|nr:hypothetical protein CPB85DRAFT_920211 [Mucidula mucida]